MPSSFINSLAEHIKSTYDLRKEELTVVFPNKRAAFYLRSRFKETYSDDIWLPKLLSIEEAVTQWSGIRLVDNVDMLFELISINSEISGNDNDISVFGSMASQMAKDFDEIDQYNVDAQHLFSYIVDEKRLGIWNLDGEITFKEQQYLRFFEGLRGYYERLRQRLESQGKGYYGMITRTLAAMSDEELLKRTEHRNIIFAGFNALTPTEQILIDKLYKNGKAEVIWDFDRYYVEDPNNEAGLFAKRYIARNVAWKPTLFSDHLLQNPIEIHLVGVTGNTIQSKALQSLLQVEVENNLAVILADEKLMIPVLNSIPADDRYPSIKVSMGYPLQQTSLSHLVHEFFNLRSKGKKVRNEGWYLWPILRLLDLEIVDVVFEQHEIAELEQYKMQMVNNNVYIFKKEEFEHCCQSESVRQFMSLLLGDDHPQNLVDSTALLDTLSKLLSFLANKIQDSGNQIDKTFLLNQVSEVGKVVNRLKEILERYPGYTRSVSDLEILYRLVSANTTIKLNSSSTSGLQLMGLLEARNLDFDTFYMVGVNEGILPADKSYGSFIPYHIRKECHLPDDLEKQAVYAYHFYRQLQNSKRVYFIYNQSGKESGGEPSRFLLQLKYELAQRNPNITLVEECFANSPEKTTEPALLSATKTPSVMDRLLAKIQTDQARQALAPTSLSTYIQCSMRFYLKYLMKIEDNSAEEETQNNVIGSIVHDTLEILYKPYLKTLLTEQLFKEVIRPSLKQKLHEVISGKFKQGLPDVGYNYLNQLTLNKLFENYLKHEEYEVAHHELCIHEVEHTLSSRLNVNGISCMIAGKADRIDQYDGQIRIIDYKTGLLHDRDVKVPETISDLRDIPEKAMQLLIYKYLYLKMHPETSPENVTASLFGLKNQHLRFDLKVENAALNEDFVATMEAFLTDLLSSMMDTGTSFSQPQDAKVKPCHFCDFKTICANTATGAKLVSDR